MNVCRVSLVSGASRHRRNYFGAKGGGDSIIRLVVDIYAAVCHDEDENVIDASLFLTAIERGNLMSLESY